MANARRQTTRRSEPANAAEEMSQLSDAVDRLQQQVAVLTQAVDELVVELQWRNNEMRDSTFSPPPHTVIHSLPRDPCTDDWQVNRVKPDTVASLQPQQQPKPAAEPTPPRSTLFD
jgi:hypothetical protein